MNQELTELQNELENHLTPHQIVAELDKYIIGQDAAKKSVAIALRNRWRRQKVEGPLREEIMPNNIIMIGPTGVGKTEIARRLATIAQAPFVKVEATKFTEVGYVGRDVESMVRELVERSVQVVKEEFRKKYEIKAKQAAEDRLLEILVPAGPSETTFFNQDNEKQIEELTETREKIRQLLRKGKMNDREIEIDVTVDSAASMQILGPFGMDEMGMNIQDIMSSIIPKKNKKTQGESFRSNENIGKRRSG